MTKKSEKLEEIKIEKEEGEYYPPVSEEEIEADQFEPISFPDLVDEVLAGKWGTGQARRLKLAQAGFDPNAVQKELVKRANGR